MGYAKFSVSNLFLQKLSKRNFWGVGSNPLSLGELLVSRGIERQRKQTKLAHFSQCYNDICAKINTLFLTDLRKFSIRADCLSINNVIARDLK